MSLLQAINPFKRTYPEQRRSIREVVSFPAWISISTENDGSGALPCAVLDVSEHGARLEIAGAANLPDFVYLNLTKDGSRRRRCQIAWRSDEQIGVCYVGPIELLSIKLGRFS